MLTVKSFVFSPVQENTYVLSDQKDACGIIDPGCYFGNERAELEEYIEQQGLNPRLLLNTHCHLDHVFGNKWVHETWDLPLHLHEKEEAVLAVAPEMGLMWGMPFENYRGRHVFLVPGETVRIGEGRVSGEAIGEDRVSGERVSIGEGRDPGERVAIGEDSLSILFLPGHSPGSVGFYCASQGFLIGGDVLFRESIGRTDLPGGDHATLLRSIREVLWPLPDDTVVYPGHGEVTTIGWEKRHNPFLR